jgi:hypothetical protein
MSPVEIRLCLRTRIMRQWLSGKLEIHGVDACLGLTRRSSAAATGSEADNLWNCFSHKDVNAQRVAVGCSDLLGVLRGSSRSNDGLVGAIRFVTDKPAPIPFASVKCTCAVSGALWVSSVYLGFARPVDHDLVNGLQNVRAIVREPDDLSNVIKSKLLAVRACEPHRGIAE